MTISELVARGYDLQESHVKCDEENNPPEVVFQRKLVVDICIPHKIEPDLEVRHRISEEEERSCQL